MLKEFLEKHGNDYNFTYDYLTNKTMIFELCNLTTMEHISVTGQSVNRLHKKHKDKLVELGYTKGFDPFKSYYLIEDDIFFLHNGRLLLYSSNENFVLKQNLKTKSKILSVSSKKINTYVREIFLDRNMHSTKEKFLNTRPYRIMSPFDIGYTLTPNYDNTCLARSSYLGDDIKYSIPTQELRDLIDTKCVAMDSDLNIVFALPRTLNEETLPEYNACLLKMFGTRNNKPIFEIVKEELKSLKGENLC